MFKRTPVHFKTLLPLILLLGACIEAQPFEASEDVTAAPDVVATPDATEPDATEPDATEPDATEPDATEPDATEPDTTEPDATEPDTTEPDATEPDATLTDTTTDTATDAPCTTTCGEKQCGDDGCGGVCGVCSDGQECNDEGNCEPPCEPDCEGKECGDDTCGGTCGLGCPLDLPVCTENGTCEEQCTPDCADKNCGDDGCGGLCGTGPSAEGCFGAKPYCNAQQTCQEACPEECPESCTEDGSTCLTQVTFQFDASCNPGSPDTIQHVWVVGSFYTVNDLGVDWMDYPEYVLTEKPNGIHTGVFSLPFGEHAYKFVTSNTDASVDDGAWENLSADLECVETAGGYTNRVLPITSTDPVMLPVVSKESCVPCGSCTPDCSEKDCGDDGCGGVCGACANGSFCDGDGICDDICDSDLDCNDDDPCTSNTCNGGSCVSLQLSAGTPCWVNAWCTDQGQCDGSPTQHQRHLASGHHHNCSIFVYNAGENSGAVKCWGNGSHGQLGQGTATSIGDSLSKLPADFSPIPLGPPAVAVAVGYLHSCALLQTGKLKCWGHADYGQLGQDLFLENGNYKGNIGQNANDMQDLAAIDLGSENESELMVKEVVAGDGFTCALLDMGRVKCFGLNDMGQLGNGTTVDSADVPKSTVKLGDDIPFVKFGDSPLENVSKVFAGESHACAINSNGHAYCWGDNSDSKLGAGLSLSNNENYTASAHQMVLGDTHIFDLFLSERHTCALVSGGLVKCWGYGGQGALGYESSENENDSLANMIYLAPVELGEGVVAQRLIQGAAEHTCAVVVNENPSLSTQQLKCWGNNYAGKLGLGLPGTNAGSPNNIGDQSGEMGDSLPDLFLAEEVHVLEVSGGANHTCALLETIEQGQKKGIKCWGHNGPAGKKGATAQPDHWILGVSADQMGDNLPWVNLGWSDAKWINDLCEQDLCTDSTP